MTDKDTKDMSASELMRYLHDRNTSCSCSMCTKVLNIVECGEHVCADAYEALADKIDAELAQARELSLIRGAELWAKANGWPDFREGEDFGADHLTHEKPDTQERIDADKKKLMYEYWECKSSKCGECPATIDGKKPSLYYGVRSCSTAQGMDIARRQAELDARKGGAE